MINLVHRLRHNLSEFQVANSNQTASSRNTEFLSEVSFTDVRDVRSFPITYVTWRKAMFQSCHFVKKGPHDAPGQMWRRPPILAGRIRCEGDFPLLPAGLAISGLNWKEQTFPWFLQNFPHLDLSDGSFAIDCLWLVFRLRDPNWQKSWKRSHPMAKVWFRFPTPSPLEQNQ